MKKLILVTLILFSTSIYADMYKWADKNGTTHFTDYPPPAEQKEYDQIKSNKSLPDREHDDPLYQLKRIGEIPPDDYDASKYSDLTHDDLQFLNLLKKRGIITEEESKGIVIHKQLMGIKAMFEEEIDLSSLENPPDPRFSSPEKTFQFYRDSLIKGDMELALSCFTLKKGKKMREIFNTLGREALKKMGEKMQHIQKIEQAEQFAKYRIKRNENGREITYYIYFANIFGDWKIDQF